MPVTVIVMTQGVGSRGDEIAAAVAEDLGLELVDRARLALSLAERVQADKGTVHRLVQGNASLLERWKIGKQWLWRCMAEEVVKLAVRGNVLIQESSAAALLGPIGHVIRVHVCAPVRPRAQALMRQLADRQANLARQRIRRRSAVDTRTRRWLFGSSLESPECCDLLLNTERLPVAQCVEQVRCLAKSAQFQPSAESRTMLADLLELTDWRGEIEVGSQSIGLSGVTSNEQAIARVEEHLRGKETCNAIAAHEIPLPFSQGLL
jgi:cytidylate kinase